MAPGVVVTGFPLVRRSNSTIEIGENTHLRSHVSEAPQISKGNIAIVADGGQGIAIGRHCAINRGTSLVSKSGIHIGDGVIVAPNVVIIDYDGHSVDPRKRMYHDKEIWRTGFYDAEFTDEEYQDREQCLDRIRSNDIERGRSWREFGDRCRSRSSHRCAEQRPCCWQSRCHCQAHMTCFTRKGEMSVEFRESEAPAGWDELVRSAIGGSYFQSSLYGRFLQGYEGSTPLYWIVREGENVAALLLARIVARGLNLLKTATICWECGPVVLAREGADEATQKILDAVVSFAEQRGFRKIGPTTPAYHDHELCTEVEDLMADRGFRSCKGATLIIDGSNGEEACWSALERSARKAVRKARKMASLLNPSSRVQ